MTWLDDLGTRAAATYSQTGEDGIIAAIFEHVPPTNRWLVDIGAGDGFTLSNTRALLGNGTGWRGVCLDIAPGIAAGVEGVRVTAENVCDLLVARGVPSDFDLLSLDIDGIDWYVLRALLGGGFTPRVAVVEINGNLPTYPAVTVAYDSQFHFSDCDYYGASLGAYLDLMQHNGYTCVHVQKSLNAFFVRTDLLNGATPPPLVHSPQKHWPRDPRGRAWVSP